MPNIFAYPEPQVGGYIPYVDLPCEQPIGETFFWGFVIGTTSPVLCTLIPWLCCPVPFPFNTSYSISSDIDCDELGAYYGATMFWTMQAVSIWGLALSVITFFKCFTELNAAGDAEDPGKVTDVFSLDALSALTSILDLSPKEMDENTLDENIMKIIGNSTVVEKKKNVEEKGTKNTIYPIQIEREISNNVTEERKGRHNRSSKFQGFDIPTIRPFYKGPNEKPDDCKRDEILHNDGECYQILSQGPCDDTELVLMDNDTKKGYCASRLCSPDRVFVFQDQLCHDPFESNICPPGRMLFTSSFGTPVCGCPSGTYEEDDDLDEDVCRPVLTKKEGCARGEVFWFKNFNTEPDCIADPCHGLNSVRSSDDLPYVPSVFDGKCYQLGKELPHCPEDTFYTLSYEKLKGICATLEEAGYTVVDDDMLELFNELFGTGLSTDTKNSDVDNDIAAFQSVSNSITALRIGQSVTGKKFSNRRKSKQSNIFLTPTHTTAYSPSSISLEGDSGMAKFYKRYLGLPESEEEEDSEAVHFRNKRQSIFIPPRAATNVFEPSFASCRAGSAFGLNAKCRQTHLPNRSPFSRPGKDFVIAPRSPPSPSCPKGYGYSIRRTCVKDLKFRREQHRRIAQGLG